MKLITFSMNSEFGIRGTRWKIRSVAFLFYMIGQTLKMSLMQGCMERTCSWRGSLNRESCNCYIQCREKSEETHVSVLTSRATVKNFSGVRLSRLGLTHWSSAWQRSCEINDITFSSTVYRDRSISWDQNAFSWCALYKTVPIWFLDVKGCYIKKRKERISKGYLQDDSQTWFSFLQKCYKKSFSNYDQKKERKEKKKTKKYIVNPGPCKSHSVLQTS